MFITNWAVTDLLDIFKSGVCVKGCPKTKTHKFTKENCRASKKGVKCAGISNKYETINVGDYCLPTTVKDLKPKEQAGYKAVKANFLNSKAGSVVMDMYLSSRAIYISMAMSIIYSIVFIYLMSWFAEVIAWCCIVLVQIGLIGMSAACFMARKLSIEEVAKTQKDKAQSAEAKAKVAKEQKDYQLYLLIGCIVFGVLALLFLCCIVCARKSLGMAVDVIDASADFVAGTKRVILVPNFHFVLQIVIFLVWLGSLVCVVSLNKIEADTMIPQGRTITWKKSVKYMALFMFFGVLWLLALIDYLSRFIVIMSASTYYFNHKRGDTEENTNAAEVMYGVKCAYFHHFGSICIGSFIIAVI